MAKKETENTAVPRKKGKTLKRLLRAAAVYAVIDNAVKLYAEHRKKRMERLERENKDSAYKCYDLFMDGREIKIGKEKFSGANIKVCMSGFSLDLREMEIDADLFLNISNVLGGVSIKVPYGVNVKCDSRCVMGGSVCQVPEYEGEEVHTIYIEAKVTLGGLRVQAEKKEDETVEDLFEESALGKLSKEMKENEGAARSAEAAEQEGKKQ